MKVKELIEILSNCEDQKALVLVPGMEDGMSDVDNVEFCEVVFSQSDWYSGDYQKKNNGKHAYVLYTQDKHFSIQS